MQTGTSYGDFVQLQKIEGNNKGQWTVPEYNYVIFLICHKNISYKQSKLFYFWEIQTLVKDVLPENVVIFLVDVVIFHYRSGSS